MSLYTLYIKPYKRKILNNQAVNLKNNTNYQPII